MRINLNHFIALLSMVFFANFVQAQVPAGFTWQDIKSVDFGTGANHFTISAASYGSGGEVELRLDANDGPVIGRAYFHHIGISKTYPDSSVNFMDYECGLKQTVSETHDVYMNFQDYTKPVLGGVLKIGAFKFDKVGNSSVTNKNRLHVYPPVPGLNPSPYYEYRVQKVSELNSSNLADVTNWETPFAWFTNSPLQNTPGYGYASYIGGWSHTYTNFELDPNTPIVVKITRKAVIGDDAPSGSIKFAAVHPAHKIDSFKIINGEVYITMSKPAHVTIDIDGQLDSRNAPRARDGWDGSAFPYTSRKLGCHAVSIFANPFIDDKPDPTTPGVLVIKAGELIPADINTRSWTTLYFEPGVHKMSVDKNTQGELVERRWDPKDVITLKSNKTIYIPGDAIVYGNFTDYNRTTGTTENIRLYGHGTISGSKILFWQAWPGYPNNEYPNSQWHKAVSVRDAKNVRVEGITVSDPANHTLSIGGTLNQAYQPNSIKWAKVIAWRPNSDATSLGGHTYIEDCFLRTQDDGHYIGGAIPMRRIVFWHDVNGATFRGDFTTQRFDANNASNVPKEILIEDIDVIYARGVFGFSNSTDFGIIQGSGGGNKILKDGVENTGQMVHFRNINIEDPKPVRHLFAMEAGKDKTGDLAGIRFENVIYKAKQTFGWKGGIIGTPNSAYRNFVFDNVSINGQKIGTSNIINPAYITTNQYLYDMTYRVDYKIPSTDYTLITTATGGIIQVNTETGTPGKVKVTAVPNISYKFSSWSGNLTGTDSIATITMDGDKGITANFILQTYTISTTASNGSITLSPAQNTYRAGDVVTVKAVGNLGYNFSSWGGDITGTVKDKKITITGNMSITANFVAVPTYTLATSATNGSIAIKPSGSVFNQGVTVSIKATPEFGYQFSGWSGDLSGKVNPASIVMNANKNITANFTKLEGTIIFATNCGGASYTASDGVKYSADVNFSSGSTYSSGAAIAGTTDDKLYQSERWNSSFSYNIPVPNGTYQVMLMFAEIYNNEANTRVFNVAMEGAAVLTNLDIWLEVGKNTAFNTFNLVTVTDGELNISFTGTKDNAKVSAIKILQLAVPTGINNVLNNLPEQTKLSQIFPNPFTTKTTIQYQLSEATPVKISIYNSIGALITTLVNEYQATGYYSVDWNANDSNGKQMENGLYLFKLETDNNSVHTLKSVLLR